MRLLGVNGEGVSLAAEHTSGTAETSIVWIPKADLLQTSPSVANRTMLTGQGRGVAVQPAISFENATGQGELLSITEEGVRKRTSLVINGSGTASFGLTQTLDNSLGWPNVIQAPGQVPEPGNGYLYKGRPMRLYRSRR